MKIDKKKLKRDELLIIIITIYIYVYASFQTFLVIDMTILCLHNNIMLFKL